MKKVIQVLGITLGLVAVLVLLQTTQYKMLNTEKHLHPK
jgi:hypothetical protein